VRGARKRRRLEVIGFRGCAKSTLASLALVLWAALEHPNKYPFIIMLADTRSQASINAASVQHELRNNELILRDYGHLKYRKIDDPAILNFSSAWLTSLSIERRSLASFIACETVDSASGQSIILHFLRINRDPRRPP
jgi:hypothetical protein